MGFFRKIIDGLKKTQQNIGFKLKQLFKVGVFDDDFFDDLETLLLSGDVGAAATMEIVDRLRDRLEETKITDPDRAMSELKGILVDMLEAEPFAAMPPAVVMVVGVNGVGKTTTIGKLAARFKKRRQVGCNRRRRHVQGGSGRTTRSMGGKSRRAHNQTSGGFRPCRRRLRRHKFG